MRMHVDRRQERVVALVRERGSLRVADLAEELGVSVVTVRRDVEALAERGVLVRRHGAVLWPGGVSAPDRAGAAPGAAAPVVGMVVPTVDRFFGDIVRGARETVEERGGRLLLGLTGYRPAEDAAQIERLLGAGAEGLLLAPSWQDGLPSAAEQERLLSGTAPIVLVERWAPPGSPAAELDRVGTDRAHGAATAVRHLTGLGHRRIALMVQESVHASRIRDGFREAVRSLGRAVEPVPERMPPPSANGAERLERTLEQLVRAIAEDGVTAALVHSDADAIALVARLRERGVRVPEDLAVVAYDDEVASLAEVPLTAVAPPKGAVGTTAARLLLSRIAAASHGRDMTPRQHLGLLPELRIRASCGAGTAAEPATEAGPAVPSPSD
ncbi:substrate-binding domain-containing protein [Streptomyces sp. NPDC048650]|uniref:substrate-binding domain-containing protein n=1 Tax=unclassified Streptomyces TaxID=2593676 RepID=UPI003710A56C